MTVLPYGAVRKPRNNQDRVYPCVDCGLLRSQDEGGTTFTVCDACWCKADPFEAIKPSPHRPDLRLEEQMGDTPPRNGLRDEYESEHDGQYSYQQWLELLLLEARAERDRLQGERDDYKGEVDKLWHWAMETWPAAAGEEHEETALVYTQEKVRSLRTSAKTLCDVVLQIDELDHITQDQYIRIAHDASRKLRAHLGKEAAPFKLDSNNWQCSYEWVNIAGDLVRCTQPLGHDWEHTCKPPLGPIPLHLRREGPMTEREQKPCRACGGSGQETCAYVEGGGLYHTHKCPRCGGSGKEPDVKRA